MTESVSQKIDRILDNSLNRDSDLYNLNLTKALLVGTLHSDENLTSSIFGLLQKHLSYESGIATLAEEVILVPTVAVSYFSQLVSQFVRLSIRKSVTQSVSQSVS